MSIIDHSDLVVARTSAQEMGVAPSASAASQVTGIRKSISSTRLTTQTRMGLIIAVDASTCDDCAGGCAPAGRVPYTVMGAEIHAMFEKCSITWVKTGRVAWPVDWYGGGCRRQNTSARRQRTWRALRSIPGPPRVACAATLQDDKNHDPTASLRNSYGRRDVAVGWVLPQLRFSGAVWIISGWSLTAIGIGLPLTAIIIFTRLGTTISPVHPNRARQLVMSGIFAISRNPMYLGLVFSLAGWAVLLSNPICLLLVWAFARLLVVVQIVPEEIALRERFGDAYDHYTRHVNRWIGRRNSLGCDACPND